MAEPLAFDPFQIEATVYNTANSAATFKLYYLVPTDSAAEWKEYANSDVTVPAKSSLKALWNVTVTGPVQYRILQSGGSKTLPCYIDDITFSYFPVDGDINLDGMANVSDVSALTNMVLGATPAYAPLGDLDASESVDVSDVTTLINMVLGN